MLDQGVLSNDTFLPLLDRITILDDVPTGESTHGTVPDIVAYQEPRKEVDDHYASEELYKRKACLFSCNPVVEYIVLWISCLVYGEPSQKQNGREEC